MVALLAQGILLLSNFPWLAGGAVNTAAAYIRIPWNLKESISCHQKRIMPTENDVSM
jgi:hypothetical protein